MPNSKIEKELCDVTKVTRNAGEDAQEYLTRLATAVSATDDDIFVKLSSKAQKWANKAVQAVEDNLENEKNNKSERISLPLFGDGAMSEPETAETAEAEKETTVATKKKAAPAKASKKAASAKAAPKKAEGAGPGRKGSYPLDAKITLKAKDNPHRVKSKDFGKYKGLKNGITVEKALEAGADWGYLRYAEGRDLISIGK